MAATNGNGHRADGLNHRALLDEAGEITDAAKVVARMAEEISEGADVQMRSLDSALSGVNQLSASLKETATQAESVGLRTVLVSR